MKKLISIFDNFGENSLNSKQQVKVIGGAVPPPPPPPPNSTPSNGGAVPFKSGEPVPGGNGSGGTGGTDDSDTKPWSGDQQIP